MIRITCIWMWQRIKVHKVINLCAQFDLPIFTWLRMTWTKLSQTVSMSDCCVYFKSNIFSYEKSIWNLSISKLLSFGFCITDFLFGWKFWWLLLKINAWMICVQSSIKEWIVRVSLIPKRFHYLETFVHCKVHGV